jgi:hypothetical protein
MMTMNTPTPERMSPARVAAITRRINRLEREAAALRASIPVAQRKPHRAERDGVVVVAVFAGRLGVASNHLAMSERGEKYIGRTVALFARELDRKGGRR